MPYKAPEPLMEALRNAGFSVLQLPKGHYFYEIRDGERLVGDVSLLLGNSFQVVVNKEYMDRIGAAMPGAKVLWQDEKHVSFPYRPQDEKSE